MFQGRDGRVCDLPSFVRCLSRLLNMQLRRGLVFVIKGGAEIGGGGCFDDRGKAYAYLGPFWN